MYSLNGVDSNIPKNTYNMNITKIKYIIYIYKNSYSSNRYTSKKINTKNIQNILKYLIS